MRPIKPLSTSTYLRRNTPRALPLAGVIMLAVVLVAGIVSMMNSIPFSIRTTYAYSQHMLGVTPRGDNSQIPHIAQIFERESPVPIERLITCRASSSQVRSIVGKWPFVVVGLTQTDMHYFLRRLDAETVVGRLPEPGKPEAIVSEPVARNLGLRLGSALQGPDNSDSYSPYPVEVVGIAQSENWLMATSIEYQQAAHFPPVDNLLVFAKDRPTQEILDRWAERRLKGERALPLAYHALEKDTREMFSILYRILDVVIGTLIVVIAVMMAMLMNIYQSQRVVEFGLLQALGYTKRQLIRRVVLEAASIVAFGWTVGVVVAFALLHVVKALLMDPRAFSLNPLDLVAFSYTLPIPVMILSSAVLTIVLRFRGFDPVGVVERRLL